MRCESRYKPLVDTLLGRVIVVEDVPTGMRMIRRSLGAVVTLDGIYIEPTGVIAGGASGADESVFTRQRELDELPVQIETIRERTDRSAAADRERAGFDRAAGDRARKKPTSGTTRCGEQPTLPGSNWNGNASGSIGIRRDMDAVRSKQADIERERESRERQIGQSQLAAEQLSTRRDERRAAMAALEDDVRAGDGATGSGAASRSRRRARSLATVDGERRTLQAMREQHDKAVERLANQISARSLQARNLELEASVIDERLAKLRRTSWRRSASTRRASARTRPRIGTNCTGSRTTSAASRTSTRKRSSGSWQIDRQRLDLEAELARTNEHIEHLRIGDGARRAGAGPDRAVSFRSTRRWRPIRCSRSESGRHAVQGGATIDLEETRIRIEELRRQIRRLGAINAEAPEDYRELRDRHEFLTTQMHDLAGGGGPAASR